MEVCSVSPGFNFSIHDNLSISEVWSRLPDLTSYLFRVPITSLFIKWSMYVSFKGQFLLLKPTLSFDWFLEKKLPLMTLLQSPDQLSDS